MLWLDPFYLMPLIMKFVQVGSFISVTLKGQPLCWIKLVFFVVVFFFIYIFFLEKQL